MKIIDEQHFYVLLNAIAYICTFVFYILKKRRTDAGFFILLIFTTSHIGAFFYYMVLYNLGSHLQIKMLPFVYLYVLTIISISPFLKSESITSIRLNNNYRIILQNVTLAVFLITLLPLYENTMIFLQNGLSIDYGEIYLRKHEEGLNLYSKAASFMLMIAGFFRFISIGLLFLFLKNYRKYKKYVWMLVVIQLNVFLTAINSSGRGGIVITLFMYIACYLFLQKYYSVQIKKALIKYFLIITIPLLLIVQSITISRYSQRNTSQPLYEWVMLYVSEGPIYFNTLMWDAEHNTKGDVNLNYFKSLLGMDTYLSYEERDEHYRIKNGRRIEIFFTFVGDFLSDFDYLGAFIACLLLLMLGDIVTRNNKGRISFESYILSIILLNLYVVGFASNLFRSSQMQRQVFFTILILFVMRFIFYEYGTSRIISKQNLNKIGR